MALVSQRTITHVKRVLDGLSEVHDRRELLYENNFPDWFIRQAQRYAWNWMDVLWDLRSGAFFTIQHYLNEEDGSIVPNGPLSQTDALDLGELFIRKLAAVSVVSLDQVPSRLFQSVQSLPRLLQLDGFGVDKAKVKLVPMEGLVSAQEEEEYLIQVG
jgi:hypothetical protein